MKKIGIIIAVGALFYLLAAFVSGTFSVVRMDLTTKGLLTAVYIIFLFVYGLIETTPKGQ